jgi:hypothetical protein
LSGENGRSDSGEECALRREERAREADGSSRNKKEGMVSANTIKEISGARAKCEVVEVVGEQPTRPARTWVKVTPFLKSTYLPSMSPLIAFEVASLLPATLKVTLEGVRVLTSSEVPWMG